VLSDIPFISVGILVFGLSALFLVLKTVSLSSIWLFFSTLLAFVAAVLDLGQTLANGIGINMTFKASEPVIRAREVLFALSIGSRFLFYWSYVAEPPRKDLSMASTRRFQKIRFLTLESIHKPHIGSWMRWGLPGELLGLGLLIAIITITALQIVWRVVPRFHQYSNVYATDAALELLVSFLLLLRLLSNTVALNSPDSMLVHTFRECLASISGLLINIAIGVGGLLYFAFTESTVGRLLQAIEIYIIAVSVVVTAILRHRDILLSTISSQSKKHKDIVFTLPEPARGSTFRITPPIIETPRMSMILGTATQNKHSSREVLRRSARRSLNHVSSWVSSRVSRNRMRHEDEEVRLWNSEKVKVDPPYTESIDTEPQASIVSLTQEPKEWTGIFRDVPANHMSIISALDAQSTIVRSMEGSIHSGRFLHPSRAGVLPHTVPLQIRTSSIPVSSVPSPTSSGVKHAEGIAATPEASPVYGLDGIQSPAGASESRTSIDELLRQQSQLDKSIEALKLFSANSSHFNSATSLISVELTRSPSTGQRTISSDVSLSNFPVPPWLTTPVPSLPSSRPSSIKRIRGNRRVHLAETGPTPVQDTYTSVLPTTSASLVDIPGSPRFNSFPHSPMEEDNESLSAEARKSSCFDSGGTQYNVTSFIGGLATPDECRQGSQEKPWQPTESASRVEAIQTSSGTRRLPPRNLPVPGRLEGLPASPAVTKLSPLTCSSRLPLGNVAGEPANVTQYQTNGQTSRAPLVALSPPTPVTSHAEDGVVMSSTKPQLESHIVTESTDGANCAQRTFVRPRPPPLAIQSYTEQNPSITRVQVLADD
ncbi:hypothetical protein HD554DRAFT_2014635, partial [Boletus coccyginus]